MNYFFVDSFDFKRIDFIHLRSNKHTNNSNNMKFSNGQSHIFSLEILIHKVDTREVSLSIEFIGTDDLDHPVQHPCS